MINDIDNLNHLISEFVIKCFNLKIVDYDLLSEFEGIIDNQFIICIAVYIDETRLIDNIY